MGRIHACCLLHHGGIKESPPPVTLRAASVLQTVTFSSSFDGQIESGQMHLCICLTDMVRGQVTSLGSVPAFKMVPSMGVAPIGRVISSGLQSDLAFYESNSAFGNNCRDGIRTRVGRL